MDNNQSPSNLVQEPENNNILYVVGTPIGNLNDISYRALEVLQNVSLIACEDTRQTKKIMNKFDIKNSLISFNQNNSLKRIPKLLNFLKSGKSIALVSDAGMPSVCDPGEDFIREAKLNNIGVICVPGPCAALTALVSSGIPSSKFIFEGFLPRKKIDREKILFDISKNEKTTIIYESPNRVKKLLLDLKELCGGEREIQVSRELTKKFEENICTSIDNLIAFFNNKEIRGEITIVLKGIKKTKNQNLNKVELKKELDELIKAGLSLSAASKYLAKKRNLKKSIIYNLY